MAGVSAAYVRLILQGEISADRLLAGTGLTAATLRDVEFVPWQTLARVFERLDQHQGEREPEWPIRLGERLNITSHGAVGFAALTAATVGEALETLVSCYRARITAVELLLHEEQGKYVLSLKDLTGDRVFFCRVALIIMKVVEALLEALLGQLPARAVQLTLPNWVADVGSVARLYRADTQPGSRFAVALPVAWRHLPSPLSEPTAHRENILESRRIIGQRGGFSTTSGMVEFLVRNALESGSAETVKAGVPPTLEAMAGRMNVTSRTLIRRLRAEGASYQGIVESLRQEYARRLLTDARLTVADVSLRLGYTEPANFGRAFRRWYGVSPAAWRKQAPGAAGGNPGS